MINVDVIIDYYFPSIKGGGPKKSIFLLCDLLKDEVKFNVIAKNRDVDGHEYCKADLLIGVNYLSSAFDLFKYLRNDVVYLNSLFSRNSILVILFYRFLNIKKLIVAPRGELFMENIRANSFFSKKLVIALVKLLGNSKLIFHVTSALEEDELSVIFKNKFTCVNIPNIVVNKVNENTDKIYDIAFVGRVIHKKGLLIFLNEIAKINRKLIVTLCVIPEDQKYWEKCLNVISGISVHDFDINIDANGELIARKLSQSRFTIVPSINENHGHVIYEAIFNNSLPIISLGCPLSEKNINDKLIINIDEEFFQIIENVISWDEKLIYDELLKFQRISMEGFESDFLKKSYLSLFKH